MNKDIHILPATKSIATDETERNLLDMSQKHSAAVYDGVQKSAM